MFNTNEFVKKLSFPRLASSEGEVRVQKLLEQELKALNIHYQKEDFVYTRFFMNFLLRVYNFIIGLFIILIIYLIYSQIIYILIPIAILCLIMSLFGREIREKIQFTFTKIGKKRKIYNYIIEFPAKNKNSIKNQNIIILAHYDSISMTFHPIFDGAIFFCALVGGTVFSIHIIIITLMYFLNIIPSIVTFQFLYGFFLAIFYSLQLFNKRHNKSFGTADNATAVASAFYNMEFFSKNELQYTNLIYVLTGAEEMGDYGADSYIKNHNKVLDTKNTYFFIPDTVGANKKTNLFAYAQGFPKKEFSPVIKNHIDELLNKNKDLYKIIPFYIPPLIHFSTDHAPLKPFGYQFIIFLSNAPIHSKKDNINNFYPEMLENFNIFMRDLIKWMDEKKCNEKT